MKPYLEAGHVIIEQVSPMIEGGRYRAKAIVGDDVEVSADVFRDGTAILQAAIRYRGPSDKRWAESLMAPVGNDRWAGTFRPTEIGVYRYTIEAWTDHFGTWRRDLRRRVEADQDVDVELEEGALLLEKHLEVVPARHRDALESAVEALRSKPIRGKKGFADPRIATALDDSLGQIMARYHERGNSTLFRPTLELRVDRERARFGAWYEFFPRSTGTKTEHGTFETAAKLLPTIADMGFDVVYLPPIHPIGKSYRKGKNNTLTARRSDVGSPWAIGSAEGGHKSVHPALGTLDDFDAFVSEAGRNGLEVALDFAVQCSPDHPWVKEHPEWFHHRPDGSIKYAENPPKKYQDIFPVNFETDDQERLWSELKSVLDHWISHGVKIFRVDNPHTKSFPFWEWVIEAIHAERPEVIFLSEAFTRPKVMQHLAKIGFTQSYTYFTWRNSKWELMEYLTELTRTDMALYFRPNFFANTPDILNEYLQRGGPPAFKIRLVLAALLSPSYGIYSGFEFFENVPLHEGSEEYLHSEKYELRPRSWEGAPSLVGYIRRLNQIRQKHTPLALFTNLQFHDADKDQMIAFSKTAPGHDPVLAIVNLNPFWWEEATVHLDMTALGLEPGQSFKVHDLVSGRSYTWHGAHNYVRLDPDHEPAHIFRVQG